MSTGKLVMLLATLTVVVNVGLAIMFTSPNRSEVKIVEQKQEVVQSDLLSNEVRRSIDKPAELAMTTPSKETIDANKKLFDQSENQDSQDDSASDEQSYVPGKSIEEIEKTMAKVNRNSTYLDKAEEEIEESSEVEELVQSSTETLSQSKENEEKNEEEAEKPDLSFKTPMFGTLGSSTNTSEKEVKEEVKSEEKAEVQIAKAEEAKVEEKEEVVQVIAASEPKPEVKKEEVAPLEIKPEPVVTKKPESPSTSGVITSVDIRYEGEILYVRVVGDKALKAKTMYVGNPERAILDILGSWKISFKPSFPENPYSTSIRVGSQKDRTRFVIDITTKKFIRRLVQIDANTVELRVDFR